MKILQKGYITSEIDESLNLFFVKIKYKNEVGYIAPSVPEATDEQILKDLKQIDYLYSSLNSLVEVFSTTEKKVIKWI